MQAQRPTPPPPPPEAGVTGILPEDELLELEELLLEEDELDELDEEDEELELLDELELLEDELDELVTETMTAADAGPVSPWLSVALAVMLYEPATAGVHSTL